MFLCNLLRTKEHEVEPRNAEARRRITFFATSLHMKMPNPRKVENMRSVTTLTPMYSETVMYSKKTIHEETQDEETERGKVQVPRPSLCAYLKATHEDEWDNVLERLGVPAFKKGKFPPAELWDGGAKELEFIMWASCRGQTLARTVHGVMQNETALLMQALQETRTPDAQTLEQLKNLSSGSTWSRDDEFVRLAHMKCHYVVTCQAYGAFEQLLLRLCCLGC